MSTTEHDDDVTNALDPLVTRASVRVGKGLRGAARPAVVLPALVAALLCTPAVAAADVTKAECVDANTTGQRLRHDGKLSAAREQLRKCADPSCPEMVRDDCTQRLDEVEHMQPTIVFVAKDAAGNDLSSVSVTVDGHPLADKLDGAELPVDPGQHVFSFAAAGCAPVTKTLVVAAGEKGRRESVAMGGGAPASPVAAGTQTQGSGPNPEQPPPGAATGPSSGNGMGTQRILGLTSAGLGVLGVAVGSIFGLMASSAWSAQKTDCASAADCPRHDQAVSDHSRMSTDATISTVGFVAGGVLLAAGAALFFTAPGATAPSQARLVVSPAPVGREGGALTLVGRF